MAPNNMANTQRGASATYGTTQHLHLCGFSLTGSIFHIGVLDGEGLFK